MKITKLAALALALLQLAACGGVPYYTADPIEAWVVDAETNQPIEDAIVVANWQLVVGSLDGRRYRGQLEVKEAVTDHAGHFHFEGFTKSNPMLYELRNEDPKITIFKPGYAFRKITNNYPKAGTETPGTHRKAQISGDTIKLNKMEPVNFGASRGFYPTVNIELEQVVKDCGWKKIPRMIMAMDREKTRLKKSDRTNYVGLISIEDLGYTSEPDCGSPKEFFEGMRYE